MVIRLVLGVLLAWAVFWLLRQSLREIGPSRPKGQARTGAAAPLSVEEAYAILGLPVGASREEVLEAHRRLIQRNHPDRGGSSHLTRQITQARDVLLERL